MSLGMAAPPHACAVSSRQSCAPVLAKSHLKICADLHSLPSTKSLRDASRRHQLRRRQPASWGQACPARRAACCTVQASALGTKWRVRPLAEEELFSAAEIQFEGFHKPQKFQLLDALARMTFRAEVLSTLKQKLQYNTPDSFACLVAERIKGDNATVGVADVSIQSDKEVLQRLPEPVEQYAYLSSMAVDSTLRRQGAAQALLAAAERMAGMWKQRYLALHLHDDNKPALQLYLRAGFVQLEKKTLFMGRTRILMAKTVKR